jgi:hypothetical protein
MNAIKLKPGTYLLSDLAETMGFSRRTLDRYIDRLSLETVNVKSQGKSAKALELNDETLTILGNELTLNGYSFDIDQTVSGQTDEPSLDKPWQAEPAEARQPRQVDEPKVHELMQRLMESEIARAKLEGQLEGITGEMKRLEQVVDAKDANIKTLEDSVGVLKASLMLEAKRTDTPLIEYSPTNNQEDNHHGLWSKLKRIVAGG